MKKETVITVILLSFFVLLIVFSRSRFIDLSLDRDEGTYAYAAWQVNNGAVMYRDIFDHKPPGIFMLYGCAFSVFGEKAASVRIFAIIYTVFSMLAVFAAVKMLAGMKAAMWSAFYYSLFQSSVVFSGIYANTELFTHLPAALALYFFAAKGGRNAFISGVFCALCILVKPVFILLAPALIIAGYIRKDEHANALYVTAGFFAVLILVCIVLALNTSLEKFYFDTVLYNAGYSYITSVSNPHSLINYAAFIKENGGLLLMLLSCVFLWYKKDLNAAFFILFFLSVAVIIVFVFKGFYRHYFQALYPALCAGAGYVTAVLMKKNKVMAAFAGVLCCAPFIILNAQYHDPKVRDTDMCAMIGPRYKETEYIGRMIKKTKKETDTLLVWQYEPQIYFEAGIKAPAGMPYLFDYDLILRPADAESFLSDISARPKNFIVADKARKLPVEALLKTRGYKRIGNTDNFMIYYSAQPNKP